MGTSSFAVPSLRALIGQHSVVCIYTRQPRPIGRGMKEKRCPVHEVAAAEGLPVRTPHSLQDKLMWQEWSGLRADVGVVVSYGLALPEPVLAAPRFGCINVHASLLPRWRGAAPIQRAVMGGDRLSGVTLIQMDSGLDTGPILLTAHVPITESTTAGSLHDTLAFLGARLLLQALDKLVAGTLVSRPQSSQGVTYARKIHANEGHIDWTLPAGTLSALVRGLSPWPGAFCTHKGMRLKILMAQAVQNVSTYEAPGTVLDDLLTVACGKGDALSLTHVQRAGKKEMPAVAFLRGYPLGPGTVLT